MTNIGLVTAQLCPIHPVSTIINYLDPEINSEVKLDSTVCFPPPHCTAAGAAATTPWTVKITAEYWNLVYGWKYIFEENTGEASFQPIILFIILRQHTAYSRYRVEYTK